MNHHNRRQHAGAAHRRQSGFDPDAYFSRHGEGFFTDIFPTLPTIDIPSPTTTPTDRATSLVLPTLIFPTTTLSSSTTTSASVLIVPTTTPTSTTSSTTVQPISTTPISSVQVQTTTRKPTAVITKSVLSTSSLASITAVAASVPTDPPTSASSDTNTGAVVGGILAGLIALAAITFGIIYLIRRKKRQEEGTGGTAPFDQGDFRRSAMLLNDPPTHADTVARGYNSPPPQMIERSAASPAPTFGTQYGRPGHAHENTHARPQYAQYANSPISANYGVNQSYPSFTPGHIVSPHPIYTPQSSMEQYSAAPAAPYPVLTRQTSASSAGSGGPFATPSPSVHGQANMSMGANMRRESLPAGDYVDLSRSSVSPFQAAQYVEISRRLNAEVPSGLATAALERELPPLPPPKSPLEHNTGPGALPFADPMSAPSTPGAQYAIDRREMNNYAPAPLLTAAASSRRTSTDSFGTSEAGHALEFPSPPMPAALVPAAATRYRIDSTPPMLPELNVSRGSVGSLSPAFGSMHVGGRDSGMLTPGVGLDMSSFPMTPSPLASSFGLPRSPLPAATSMTAVPSVSTPLFPTTPISSASDDTFIQAPPTPRPASATFPDPKNRTTTFSMYDPEDAYGGI